MDRIASLLDVFKKVIDLRLIRESRSEIMLPNRSKIVALPASPTTVRGYSGHVFLDEFAFHKDSKAIWTAMLPIISKGYSVRVVSTPAGKSGKFYELWENATQLGFSKHKVTIYDAINEGLNIDLEMFKRTMDADAFAQEFECEFIDEAFSYFPLEMILNAVSSECDSWDGIKRGIFYMGIDIGRKRDITAIVVVEKLGDVFYVRHIDEMYKENFEAQRLKIEMLKNTYQPHRICIDSTGLGMQLAEELQRKYGSTVESVTFTQPVKESLVTYTRMLFEKNALKIMSHQGLIRDIHSIKKYVTEAGNIRYDADRTESEGHGDYFWALALAVHAGAKPSEMPYIVSRSRRQALELTRGY
ncbi:Mu-like prophage FluMu protein gp28 [Thermodesulfovibrio sp. N1]|nr:Mu-like prophage FluMu protein gp28 [Thermodesulfovibrio sp. N1]